MSSLTHNLVMRADSWHARWYRHWVNLGGTPAAYKENFCRYVRVLLIWAPLRWFFKGRIKSVAPWAATIIACVLAFIGVASYLWPNITLKVLERLGIIVGVIVGIVLIFVIGALIYDHDPQTAKKVAKWVTLPLWILPVALLLGIFWIWDKNEQRLRASYRFLEHKVLFGFPPMGVLMCLWVAGILSLLFYKDPVKTAIVIGCIIGAIALIIGAVIVVEEIKERRRDRRRSGSKPKTRLGRAYEGTADTVKLAYTYVDSKKKGSRICPFIDFEDTTQSA